jgi:general secretion pathway protein G
MRHSSKRGPRRIRGGFTLIELVVVLIVLGLLAAFVAPQVLGRVSEAKDTAARTQMALLSSALDNYRLDNSAYPTTAQGLLALRVKPGGQPAAANWRGPYLRKDVPMDPWGHPYLYSSPGVRNPNGFDLMTLGRDQKEGGTGEDIDIIGQ